MPIIPPSRSFEGSDLSQNAGFRYIKPEIPQLIVSAKENKDGLWIFFLPSYKQDAQGNGVWYKKVSIRQNFGTATKERYMIPNINEDPVEYFAKNYKMFYPAEAEVQEESRNGMTFKVHPPYGNRTDRVIYNVIEHAHFEAGVKVFDIPLFNGASLIDDYHRKPDMHGKPVDLICNPENCTPVFVQCKSGGGTTPWSIQPNARDAIVLPEQLSSSEYLINLDEIFVVKPKEELLEKLEAYFGADKFERCMAGFPGMKPRAAAVGFKPQQSVTNPTAVTPVVKPALAPAVAAVSKFSLPATLNIPKAPTMPAAPQVREAQNEVAVPKILSTTASNPTSKLLNKDEIMAFLQED